MVKLEQAPTLKDCKIVPCCPSHLEAAWSCMVQRELPQGTAQTVTTLLWKVQHQNSLLTGQFCAVPMQGAAAQCDDIIQWCNHVGDVPLPPGMPQIPSMQYLFTKLQCKRVVHTFTETWQPLCNLFEESRRWELKDHYIPPPHIPFPIWCPLSFIWQSPHSLSFP